MGDTTITRRYQFADGSVVVKEFNAIIDIREYEGTPGYAQLVVAANATNKRISAFDIAMFLGTGNNERPISRIRKYRWLFRRPGITNNYGRKPDLDGEQARAVEIMRQNKKLSLRDLARVLKGHGVSRKREWIRRHRCD